MKKRQSIVIILVLVLQVMNLQAQSPNLPRKMSTISRGELGTPFIRNYAADEYGGKLQNWAVVQDKRGVMYFGNGNGNGVLEFDGKYWRLIRMPNHSTIRSLGMDQNGTIYVGAVGEFGYLTFDKTGKLAYMSLSNRLPEKDKNLKHIWGVHATTHGTYFVTRKKIFRFSKGKIETVSLSFTIEINNLDTYQINDAVIVKDKNDNSLYVLTGSQVQLLPHTDKVPWVVA